jgi:dTDP-glucose 4,6-dehydratase
MRVLITGGAGFIGSNFVRRALSGIYSGIETVVVLDKLTYAGNLNNLETIKNNSNYRFVLGDICDEKLVREQLLGVDTVVNFAAESHVDRSISSSDDFLRTNLLGVKNLLDAILESEKNIRFLQVSTDEVYGSIPEGSWDENCPLLPNSPYSASKAAADLLVRAYVRTHNIDAVITRCSNNYGPFQFPEKLIPLFVTNLIQGKKIPIYGDGMNVRDWLHVDDHCDGIFLALTKGKKGEIYNIGGGKELTNLDITDVILNKMGKDYSHIVYVEDRKGHDRRYSINCNKISNQLGYFSKVNFDEGLTQTIKWYENHKSWWEPLKNI